MAWYEEYEGFFAGSKNEQITVYDLHTKSLPGRFIEIFGQVTAL